MPILINQFIRTVLSANILLWLLPLLLVVPNILLDFTETGHWLSKVTNVVLPFGIYTFLISLSRNIGRSILLFFPVIMYSTLQLILLYLYGESIIAIDMFVSMLTSNVGEASELLGNLSLAIILGWILYLPILVYGGVLVYKRIYVSKLAINVVRKVGIVIMSIGLLLLFSSYQYVSKFDILRDIFPVNVVSNTISAVSRTIATQKYFETSRDFNYAATTNRNGEMKEIYVLVIGETSRAENWQLFGYERQTNPLLSRREELLIYPKSLAECNTTYKSVPLMLAPVSTETFGDSIYTTQSVITAFNQVGYHTGYFSNQAPNRSFIDFFSHEADIVEWLNEDGKHHFDSELLNYLTRFINSSKSNKIFVVLHTYGSHFKYSERYLPENAVFLPDNASEANPFNRAELLNAYDNTILETDRLLNNVIEILDSCNCVSSMLYLSDHGEDIFDDDRNRFLHSSPVPTYHQLHVPLLMWMSSEYIEMYPNHHAIALQNQSKDVASNRIVFDTLISIAGINTSYYNEENSLISQKYVLRNRYYLNDYNEEVSLKSSGLKDIDFENISRRSIAY